MGYEDVMIDLDNISDAALLALHGMFQVAVENPDYSPFDYWTDTVHRQVAEQFKELTRVYEERKPYMNPELSK